MARQKALLVFGFIIILGAMSARIEPEKRTWMNLKLTPAERAELIVSEMTLSEKLGMVHGYPGPYVGNIPKNSRLGIPALHLEDGPQGVGDGTRDVTCWPSAFTVLQTWDTDLMQKYGAAMGLEQKEKGTNVMLGPMVNIMRISGDGRDYETFGEDPYLTSTMGVASIIGIQSNGIIATVKHLIDNDQEYNRTLVSAEIDERTQYEIYLPAFREAVYAGVGAVMCSYNRINNAYACENNEVINVGLKLRFGFQGFVMSDWGATHSTIESANSGLDMEMPNNRYFGSALAESVGNGSVSIDTIDQMNLRILTSMFASGLFDRPPSGNLSVNVQSEAHTKLARELGDNSAVLLKNDDDVLPLDPHKLHSIGIIGNSANIQPVSTGGGSGHVIAPYIISPLSGIHQALSNDVVIKYASNSSISTAVDVAKTVDVAVVFVAVDSHEGADRATLALPGNQDELVRAVAAVNSKTVVIINTPGPILMPWVDKVKSILCAYLDGQENGLVIADVLFGKVNPSGKLAMTFPTSDASTPYAASKLLYPGVDNEVYYKEKLLVGYRWYDEKRVTPLFPFGHGLSYTSFDFSDLTISRQNGQEAGWIVSFDLRNTGHVTGKEVAQVYIEYPDSAGEPLRQLRGFKKVELTPGEKERLDILVLDRWLTIWDTTTHSYTPVKGEFKAYVGSSSRSLVLDDVFTVS